MITATAQMAGMYHEISCPLVWFPQSGYSKEWDNISERIKETILRDI